jgi:hypothetical protein
VLTLELIVMEDRMTNPDPGSSGYTPTETVSPAGLMGAITIIATATVVHPPGADLSELPGATPAAGNDEMENH